MRGERPLTLAAVPLALLAEYGLPEAAAGRDSYRCDDAGVTLVAIKNTRAPLARMLNEAAVRGLLRGIRANASIPPIHVISEQGKVRLLNGLHRLRVSIAVGFTQIPARFLSLEEAEGAYGYSPPAA